MSLPDLKTLEKVPMPARKGTLHIVVMDRDLGAHNALVDHDVMLDGKVARVRGMEVFMKAIPPKKGDTVGLLV